MLLGERVIRGSCVISAFSCVCAISAISCVCVSSVQWMMGNTVQGDVWWESQYDGEATFCGSRTEGHEPYSRHLQ